MICFFNSAIVCYRPPPTTQSTEQPKKPTPIPSGSGDGGPCGDDDEDCESSGVEPVIKPKDTTDDIYLSLTSPRDTAHKHTPSPVNQPNIRSSTSSSFEIISVNFTETLPRSTPKSLITTTRAPQYVIHVSSTTQDTGKGHGRGGGSSVVEGADSEETKQPHPLSFNIGVIVGVVVVVVIIILVSGYILYKYKSRDEGSYKVDESKNYSFEPAPTKPPPAANGGMTKTNCNNSKPRKKDVKEWYV